jgi:nucleotide-binding universal stress UspA family protein
MPETEKSVARTRGQFIVTVYHLRGNDHKHGVGLAKSGETEFTTVADDMTEEEAERLVNALNRVLESGPPNDEAPEPQSGPFTANQHAAKLAAHQADLVLMGAVVREGLKAMLRGYATGLRAGWGRTANAPVQASQWLTECEQLGIDLGQHVQLTVKMPEKFDNPDLIPPVDRNDRLKPPDHAGLPDEDFGKYEKPQDFFDKLLPGEPWFALRARDRAATQMVFAAYRAELRELGLDDQANDLYPFIAHWHDWRQANADKVRDPD